VIFNEKIYLMTYHTTVIDLNLRNFMLYLVYNKAVFRTPLEKQNTCFIVHPQYICSALLDHLICAQVREKNLK